MMPAETTCATWEFWCRRRGFDQILDISPVKELLEPALNFSDSREAEAESAVLVYDHPHRKNGKQGEGNPSPRLRIYRRVLTVQSNSWLPPSAPHWRYRATSPAITRAGRRPALRVRRSAPPDADARKSAADLREQLPNARFDYRLNEVEGEYGYLRWSDSADQRR